MLPVHVVNTPVLGTMFQFVRRTPSKSRDCARARNACRTGRQRIGRHQATQDKFPFCPTENRFGTGHRGCACARLVAGLTCVTSIFGIWYLHGTLGRGAQPLSAHTNKLQRPAAEAGGPQWATLDARRAGYYTDEVRVQDLRPALVKEG